MIRKEIHYFDLNDEPQVEEAYFHLYADDLIEMEGSVEGGLGSMLENLVRREDTSAAAVQFRDFISLSYGFKSPDGSRFDRADAEQTRKFVKSSAFDALFIELGASDEAATEFFMGILPRSFREKILALPGDAKGTVDVKSLTIKEPEEPAWIRENRDPNPKELRSMTQQQLLEAYQKKMKS
jgi:hypothetical protein